MCFPTLNHIASSRNLFLSLSPSLPCLFRSIYISVYLFVCMSVYLTVCLSFYMSVCLPVCISLILSMCPFLCLLILSLFFLPLYYFLSPSLSSPLSLSLSISPSSITDSNTKAQIDPANETVGVHTPVLDPDYLCTSLKNRFLWAETCLRNHYFLYVTRVTSMI